jgi:hypothetical protein
MGILKFGIIGFLIMMPFFYVSYCQTQMDYYQQIYRDSIFQSIEDASGDAAFAMKTYSESSFDALNSYQIDVPRENVVQIFFDSLEFRDFAYSKLDFPFMIFVEYDGVVVYHPASDTYYPKAYYYRNKEGAIESVNLGDEFLSIDSIDLTTSPMSQVEEQKEHIILMTIESCLNRVSFSLGLENECIFELPETDDGFYSVATDDLSFIVFYSSSRYDGLGNLELVDIKPSGIMKMKEVLPIDI